MVMFNTNMRGPDQTGEIVNPSITDEGAPLIKIKELRTRKKLVLYMTHKNLATSQMMQLVTKTMPQISKHLAS